jgi:hypothetical protein
MTQLLNEEYGHDDLDEAKSSIPSRDRLSRMQDDAITHSLRLSALASGLSSMQDDVLDALGDSKEHQSIYAKVKSGEMGDKKAIQRAIKNVDAEIKKVAKTTREYIAALKAVRARIVKNQRNKK